MKAYRLFLLIPTLLIAMSASAQFRTALGGGITGLRGMGSLVYIEPSYKIRSFAAGIKGEAFLRFRNSEMTTSWSLFGHYYFIKGPFRVFGGAGIGVYSPVDMTSMCDCSSDRSNHLIGFYPKVGLEYKHLVVTADYNFIGRVTETSQSDIPNTQPNPIYISHYSINYFSLKVGLLLGGGK